MEHHWYAVYTRAKWEKAVANQLNKINIENYCPLNRVQRQWSDRKKLVDVPLFTSYVFVCITSKQMNTVRALLGVVNFVYWLGKPAIIPGAEIQAIKQFLLVHHDVKIEADLNVKDRIKILTGPFIEKEGQVLSISRKYVKVLLPSLRCFLVVEIEKEHVNLVEKCPVT
jgi:transcription antitermination factor NusG